MPGPGPESVTVAIYAVDPDAGKWDLSTWDGAYWGALDWRDIGCEITEAKARWGATDEAGILSVVSAGELDIATFDPLRVLDPLNSSSPFYGAIRPGTPVRLRGLVPGPMPAATGVIDEATFDLASSRGRLRCIDGIAYLAQAQLATGAVLPNTLRARVRSIVSQVGLATLVPVEAEAATDPPVDPPVAAHDGVSASAWEVIVRAAEDALWVVWLDPTGTLRFRSWGALPDGGLSLGCSDPDSADELWLSGVTTLDAATSGAPIRNKVRAYSAGTTWQPAVIDGPSQLKYGVRPYEVERIVPGFSTWAGRILADRADAGLEVGLGEVRPADLDELVALLNLDLLGPAIIRVRDDEHGPVVDLDVGVLGATIGVTSKGWRFQFVTSIPRVAWEGVPPEPPIIPPEPPTGTWHTETRTYTASSDALLALTSGGAEYGAGAADSLPVGGWSGWTYRAAIKFPTIPWTKVRAVTSAKLNVRTSSQVRVGFGSNPKLEVRRATTNWSAGSSSSPSSGNAVVWPGPSTTTSGAKTSTMPSGEGVEKDIDITAIVRAWAPSSVGGSGASQYGIVLREISSSTSYTTEVWPVENATSGARPALVVVVEVFD